MVAWSVPAISVATAVPAFAGSGCCSLSASGSANWRAGELNYVDMTLDITNECSTAVSNLTVILTICGLDKITYTGQEFLQAGWVQGGQGNKNLDPDGNGCFTLTFTTAQSLAGNATIHPVFTAKTMAYVGNGDHRPPATITATVSTTGCSAETFAIVLPQVG
jgi:hypothetical protein